MVSSTSYTCCNASMPTRDSSSSYCCSTIGAMRAPMAMAWGVSVTFTRRWSWPMRSRSIRPASAMRASTPVMLGLEMRQRSHN